MNLDEAAKQVRAGKRVARKGKSHNVLYVSGHSVTISDEVWCSFRPLTDEERSATDWLAEHITWAVKHRVRGIYIQEVDDWRLGGTRTRREAMRFLTLEAAREERNGWVSRKNRKNYAIVKITTRA